MTTTSPRHIDGVEFLDLVRYPDAVVALESAFSRLGDYGSVRRQHLPVSDGDLLLMPAHGPEGVGVKLVTVNPANRDKDLPLIHGIYVMFAPGTLAAEATLDGAALTAMRTAAVSALATRHLARPDARRLVVFGAGPQAAAHIEAMCAVRPIEHVIIVGTGSPRTDQLRRSVSARGIRCELGTPADVARADIICTCTTSATPLFAGEQVAPGAHVNAIGAYQPANRELDGSLLAAARVVVETRASALAEAGDVILAIAEGWLDAADLIELRDVVCGTAGRSADDTVTVFKSVGLALEDLVVARTALRRLAVRPAGGRMAP
jgi:ornithine cyclodeaminase/alanine dehydrogenase-like protein (mu-crystallin family)